MQMYTFVIGKSGVKNCKSHPEKWIHLTFDAEIIECQFTKLEFQRCQDTEIVANRIRDNVCR